MTVDEIFLKVAYHLLNGVMFHDQLVQGFRFLSLPGYTECQEYHYLEERKNYNDFRAYYIEHYNQLINIEPFKNETIIPLNWFKHDRFDVDPNTKRTAIRDFYKKWMDWERDTKKFLEEQYLELHKINEIAAAIIIQHLIQDVDEELRNVENHFLKLESIGYDIVQIYDEQDLLYEKYHTKKQEIYKEG